jgi:thiamine pyrophosphokinase
MMRGLAFTGGEGPPPDIARRLCEGADLVAAADSGLIAAEAAGIRPDWITGDMDSLDDLQRLEKYPSERVIRHPREKDDTDTELVLKLLWEKGCDEVWILGGGGGRVDHLFAVRSLFERDRFPRRWFTAAEDIFGIEAPGVLRWNAAPGGVVSVFPLGGGPWKASSGGLRWPLDHLNWNRGFFGVSNVITGESFSIKAEAGRFMIVCEGRMDVAEAGT